MNHTIRVLLCADIYTPYSRRASSWLSARCIMIRAQNCAGILNLSADKSTNDFASRPKSAKKYRACIKLHAQLIKRIRWFSIFYFLRRSPRGVISAFQFPVRFTRAAADVRASRDCNRITFFSFFTDGKRDRDYIWIYVRPRRYTEEIIAAGGNGTLCVL